MSYTASMVKRAIFLLPFFVGAAAAQLTSNSVTVTASRNTSPQPDQVVFRVAVDGPLDTTRDAAIAALDGSGITAANFAGVGTVQQYDPQAQKALTLIEWTFSLPVAISDMKSTIGLLSAVQKSNAQKNNGLTISFSVSGMQVSPKVLQAQTCSLADLISDARAQAQKMASAAGVSLGTILALSGASLATTDAAASLFSAPVYQPVCSLTVKFALGGF